MFYEDLEYVAKAIRLSFHDCKGHSEGYGCDGCVNLNHIDNIGLEGIMEKLRPRDMKSTLAVPIPGFSVH